MFTDDQKNDPPEVYNLHKGLTLVERALGVQTPSLCPFSNCRKPNIEINHGRYGESTHTTQVWCRDCRGQWEKSFTLKEIGSIG